MADNDTAAMQARIDHLKNAIKQHKEQQQFASAAQYPPPQHYHHASTPPYRGHYQYNNNDRYHPYATGRRGRGGYGATYQNRTLVNAKPSATPPASGTNTPAMQQKVMQTIQAMKNTPEKSNVVQHPSALAPSRELVIEGVRFLMKEDGSKLTRVTAISETSLPTPKKAVVAGVEFFRTKNGNLLRRATISAASKPASKPLVPCENWTKNGVCDYGPRCFFDHDAGKVAMCKPFLRNGTCVKGTTCDLSHKPTYNRVPACAHFLNGSCTNDACRYPHVSISPGTLVCRPFATLGYCEKGTECDSLHVFECPDYANNGDCPNEECRLKHAYHAHAERQKADASEDSEFEDDDDDADVVGDDDSYDLVKGVALNGGVNGIARNHDYISFS